VETQVCPTQGTGRQTGCRFKKNQRQIERNHAIELRENIPVRNHSYSLQAIQLAVTLVLRIGVSFRGVGKVFAAINLYLQINLGCPSHTSVLNWTKKQGVANIREKKYFNTRKWVLIIDESIQFGDKKLLLAIAFPEEKVAEKRAVGFQDLTPLILQVGKSWKSADISDLLPGSIEKEQIPYVVSDGGNNLRKAVKDINIKHIQNVNHKFSLIIRDVLEKKGVAFI
jgi:hypothetical protein